MYWIFQCFFTLLILNVVHSEDSVSTREFIYNPNVDIWYSYHSVPLTWLNAKIICSDEESRLAMPKNIEESLALREILTENLYNGEIYLDLHDYFEQNDFISQDYNIQYFHHDWDNAQPNKGNGHCVAMSYIGKYRNNNCQVTLPFICQKDNHPITNTTIVTGDLTYKYEPTTKKYIKLHMHMRTWPQARAICNAEGGRLAIIENKEQETFMVNMYKDPANRWPGSSKHAHIGFHDTYRSRLFYTVADDPLEKVGYINWDQGEPNNVKEMCGSMHELGGLNDELCTLASQFFCERFS